MIPLHNGLGGVESLRREEKILLPQEIKHNLLGHPLTNCWDGAPSLEFCRLTYSTPSMEHSVFSGHMPNRAGIYDQPVLTCSPLCTMIKDNDVYILKGAIQ